MLAWEAADVGIEESVVGFGSMFEFEGCSPDKPVGMGILMIEII